MRGPYRLMNKDKEKKKQQEEESLPVEENDEESIDRLEDEGGPVLDIPEFLKRKTSNENE